MKTVTVSFKNSRNQDETATFHIYPKAERDTYFNIPISELTALVDHDRIGREDWADDKAAVVEKTAALQAGIQEGETFYYTRTA